MACAVIGPTRKIMASFSHCPNGMQVPYSPMGVTQSYWIIARPSSSEVEYSK